MTFFTVKMAIIATMNALAGGALAVAALFALTPTETAAQQFVSNGRDTLRGLIGVEVLVEPLQPEVERNGLTAASIRSDVEQQLRAGGITIYPSQVANTSPAKPYLYVHLNAVALQTGMLAIGVQLQLRQTLRSPVTGSNVVNAMTWDQENVVAVEGTSLDAVRMELRDYVGTFVRDWVAVH